MNPLFYPNGCCFSMFLRTGRLVYSLPCSAYRRVAEGYFPDPRINKTSGRTDLPEVFLFSYRRSEPEQHALDSLSARMLENVVTDALHENLSLSISDFIS